MQEQGPGTLFITREKQRRHLGPSPVLQADATSNILLSIREEKQSGEGRENICLAMS